MPWTRVHNKEHCVLLQLFNSCPVPDRWCFILTLSSRQHNALSCQGLMEVPLTVDANSGSNSVTTLQMLQLLLATNAWSRHSTLEEKQDTQKPKWGAQRRNLCRMQCHNQGERDTWKGRQGWWEENTTEKHRRKNDYWRLKQTKQRSGTKWEVKTKDPTQQRKCQHITPSENQN